MHRLVCRLALFSGMALGVHAFVLAQSGEAPQVVTITGNYHSDLRAYSHYAPGLVEFREHRQLAPGAELRFALMTRGGPLKPLPLVKASLEAGSWHHDLPVSQDGWFTLPDSDEAYRRKAQVRISRRIGGASVGWVIDVHTPGLPAQVYRLGDLRLECRVYLAIEWVSSRGTRLMGRRLRWPIEAPMDKHCGRESVFINGRPWPRLQAYVISEGNRKVRHELGGLKINNDSLSLALDRGDGGPPWTSDALVEFVFYDGSHWAGESTPATGQ